MRPRLSSGTLDARVRAAWQTQVGAAKKTPGLLSLLVRQRHALLPRFATAYHQLRALPRRRRRHWQRHWHASLGGLALLLTLGQGCYTPSLSDVGSLSIDTIALGSV